jgi:putative nucleotidyltransferase with HDIG domain
MPFSRHRRTILGYHRPMDVDSREEMRAAECRKMLDRWLREGDFDRVLPEVAALRGVPQPEEFHAEGDAYVHTMLALDSVSGDEDPRLFWGVLLHDIGKAATTAFVEGRWRSHSHDRVGAAMAADIMARIGFPEMAEEVAWLVKNHLFHHSWNYRPGRSMTPRQLRFTRHPLFPLLVRLCRADAAGSIGGSGKGEAASLIAAAASHDTSEGL